MLKVYMTHEDVNQLLREGYDKPRGWSKEEPYYINIIRLWKTMWQRCYDPTHPSYPLYIESIIHDDFRIFSNYYNWIIKQPRFREFCSTCDKIIWTIDKDMKKKDNIHYFPEYMTLCTSSENSKERQKRNPNPSKPIIGINIDNNTILIFKSPSQAIEKGFKQPNIVSCLKGRLPHYKRYKWLYLYKEDRK